jgi:hypothetical protein
VAAVEYSAPVLLVLEVQAAAVLVAQTEQKRLLERLT